MKVRIATFNVENLLQRFDFYSYGKLKTERVLKLLGVDNDAENINLRKALYLGLTDDSRQQTGQAIRDTNADIICMQEIDNIDVLNDFHEFYLVKTNNIKYGWRRVIEGNDNRGIDVAVMSKNRIDVKSHAHHTFDDFGLFNSDLDKYGLSPGDRIFRRDCLEVNLKVNNKPLTLFVCHFKSMSGGREETLPVREAEAKAVKKIIEDKYNDPSKENWIILGDLNDYLYENNQKIKSGVDPLIENNFAINIIENLSEKEQWTHYYSYDGTKHQLDYILVSPEILKNNQNLKPEIIRNGQPYRVPGIENVLRYPRVGFDRPKASDHCPVVVEIDI